MRIVSVPNSAVPVSEIGHDGRSGAVAVPCADQLIVPDGVSVPCAVPASFSDPAQVAVKLPLAVVAVWSVTVHLKSVQVLGVGMMLDDVQTPMSAPVPIGEGLEDDPRCSKPVQAEARAIAHSPESSRVFI